MPTKAFQAQEGWSQDKQRVQKVFWDQHKSVARGFPNGRPWWAMCEKQVDGTDAVPCAEMIPVSSDMLLLPTGKLEIAERVGVRGLSDGDVLPNGSVFVKGWSAPWQPEPKYITLAAMRLQGNRFRIDYQRMVTDYREANIAYYTRVNEECAARNWPSVKLYAPVNFQTRSIKGIGAPPKTPKIPEAALAGDLWLLGFSDEENETLKELLARDNGRGAEAIAEEDMQEPLAGRAPKIPATLSEFASWSAEDIAALHEMVTAKREREAKKHQPAKATAA